VTLIIVLKHYTEHYDSPCYDHYFVAERLDKIVVFPNSFSIQIVITVLTLTDAQQ